mmetsp:Transcript_17720/g.44548  ORF Transcript_17720/g.44548 Transcript_17720/m.44548 type:complete len:237 (+) Transcript_17720:149-859(+)
MPIARGLRRLLRDRLHQPLKQFHRPRQKLLHLALQHRGRRNLHLGLPLHQLLPYPLHLDDLVAPLHRLECLPHPPRLQLRLHQTLLELQIFEQRLPPLVDRVSLALPLGERLLAQHLLLVLLSKEHPVHLLHLPRPLGAPQLLRAADRRVVLRAARGVREGLLRLPHPADGGVDVGLPLEEIRHQLRSARADGGRVCVWVEVEELVEGGLRPQELLQRGRLRSCLLLASRPPPRPV